MMFLDGIPVGLIPSRILKAEYDAIRTQSWHEFYQDKGAYLFLRQRTLMYELQSRGIETDPPYNFVGFPRHRFGYYKPPTGRMVSAMKSLSEGVMDGDDHLGMPRTRDYLLGAIKKAPELRQIHVLSLDGTDIEV